MLSYRNLLALGVLVYCIQANPTSIKIDIHCDEPSVTNWCAYMELYEEDTPHNHDDITTAFWCTTEHQKSLDYPKMNLGWDGSLDYEIGYQLTHTCTKDGKHKCMKSEIQTVWEYSEGSVSFNNTIYDIGYDGKCKDINAY
ncbi:hypothetical protein B9Z55_015765 [Caenorhabditis nigoni]|uniref:DUF281 domain-containing protein n=1 Tax=Caenorhabditis nigoni TaxID=1611254 RepID=A0A2G5UBS0_9PELO|nr:hypothetical protein B9Z55_015765 [Caenorhabditis nigoni]